MINTHQHFESYQLCRQKLWQVCRLVPLWGKEKCPEMYKKEVVEISENYLETLGDTRKTIATFCVFFSVTDVTHFKEI